jgi:hypothetical protein
MKKEIYIFGSSVRGEASPTSDVDVLVIQDNPTPELFPNSWSVYSKRTIEGYYKAGRLFAWHLHLEAVEIFPREGNGFLAGLGVPSAYTDITEDLADLRSLLQDSLSELARGSDSPIFELGIAYTAIRDIAMAASWHLLPRPTFGRYAPYELPVHCPIPREVYDIAMSARHTSTRGFVKPTEYHAAIEYFKTAPLADWIDSLWSAACPTHS